MRDIIVVLNSVRTPVEGQVVDIAPFGYAYRKDLPNNPSETMWLLPHLAFEFDNILLCGFLWENAHALDRVEVEFPSAAAPDAKDLKVVSDGEYWAMTVGDVLVCAVEPVVTPQGTTVYTFQPNPKGSVKVEAKLYVTCSGANPSTGAPVVRVYPEEKRWEKPQAVEIEWAFDRTGKACDGRIEAYDGFVGKIEPLESGNGIELAGEHHWRESVEAKGRRGIRTTVYGAGDASANVTVWTGCGTVTFAPADLAKGPILIPSMGVYIALAGGGITARQFQEKLAAGKRETLRQRVRKHAEQSWAGAMGTYYQLDKLPAFPVPPMESPMQIDVPEKELVAQWRLGAWHLTRHAKKLDDRMYGIPIWAKAQTYFSMESCRVIEALDLLGMHEIAEKGLNYWLFVKKHGFSPAFSDNDALLIRSEGDGVFTAGHGYIMKTAAIHSRLTDNKAWFKEAAPILKKACEWTIRQRKYWNSRVPRDNWSYGLLPPTHQTETTKMEIELFYNQSDMYYAGLKAAAEVLSANGMDGATELLKEAESWRQDLRIAADRSADLSRVVQVDDGTYRRYMPIKPYLRMPYNLSYQRNGRVYCRNEIAYFSSLQFAEVGVCDIHDSIIQEMLDVVDERMSKLYTLDFGGRNPALACLGPTLEKLASEDVWFNTGGYYFQPGYNTTMDMYLALDDMPLFLRAMYNAYAALITPAQGYTFYETPFGGDAPDKTFEEGAFLKRIRMMLVMEEGQSLWLARATPRAWLEQGKKISIRNAPTFFGTLSYEIVSDVDNGHITATVQMPARNAPESVLLRFRHPKSASIKSVEVNGKPWSDFDNEKETIRLKGLSGPVAVRANY